MMSLNVHTKSALLAFSMMFSAASMQGNQVTDFLVANKEVCSALVVVLMAMKVRLDTKPSISYTFENWQQEIKDLFNSYNIFDAESRKIIINFFDKYVIGAPFKKKETTTRTKKEDGSVFTVKGDKIQKPVGLVGLVDAYVLMQLGNLTDFVPVIAGFYVLVNDPCGSFSKSVVNVEFLKSVVKVED